MACEALKDANMQRLVSLFPIGCRDTATSHLLNSHGIKAYFSGCMTLTLGYKYKTEKRSDKIYFVDPYFVTHWNFWSLCRNACYLLMNYSKISKIASRYPCRKIRLHKEMMLVTFCREYSKIFEWRTLMEAEYINHQSVEWKQRCVTDQMALCEAEKLVKKYASAKLVVTSRIHCALPCLGLETPVIFTDNYLQDEVSSCRLGGLKQLLNVMTWRNGQLQPEFEYDNILELRNKETWRPLAEKLKQSVNIFCQ